MEAPVPKENKVYVVGAIALPPFLSWLFVQGQFWLGAGMANPVGVLFAIAGGVFIAEKTSFSKGKYKSIFWSAYLALSIIGVLYVSLLTSCANGDCI